ncbi:MAG: hydantoinase/oxoprolinase family protein [Alphaproteobacteria bacterium]
MRVATDIGGTFTDLVYYEVDAATGEIGAVRTEKTDSTPPAFEAGILAAFTKAGIAPRDFDFFVHGTTVVINALLSRQGAKTALITTKGFRDVLEIARGNRPDLFNLNFAKPRPFVPRHLRAELDERTTYKGEVLRPVQLDGLPAIVGRFRDEGVEAIAVCFLHAYANPANEAAAAAALKAAWPEVSVVASHEITREWREYERTSTAVMAAYVHPTAERYLSSLEHELRSRDFLARLYVMQSSGGIATVEAASTNPLIMAESGPASGVLGAVELGRLIGEPHLVSLDIGGTTAKCALVQGPQPRITTEYKIEQTRTYAGYPIQIPVIDMVEIGNGGGSIAWIDEGGKLNVGPKSAGAQPGPVAYGRGGTEPTTTDAHLMTGRIDPDYFLGGEITPDMAGVRRAITRLAERLNVTPEAAARGIIRIANANMVNALKWVSVNKGHDSRDFALVAFGGGGAMHAVALAEELRMPRVIIPVNAAVFSAWGMLVTDLRRDLIRTKVVRLDDAEPATVAAPFADMEHEAERQFAEEGIAAGRLVAHRYADMRYVGQEHTVKIDFPAGAIDDAAVKEAVGRFHDGHERAYTFRLDRQVEIVNYHLAVTGRVDKPTLPKMQPTGPARERALRGRRTVDFDEQGIHETAIYEREYLDSGTEIVGPAIVEEPASTLLLPPGKRLVADDYGNLIVHMSA